ncbi:MAG TPA: peptidoglycan-associated lipoprotein Pal [Hyphomicrobiales bacterium]|nr:peptidoglycan-associated lipoprotein Pal [Hyphomicrobiales bacterium]
MPWLSRILFTALVILAAGLSACTKNKSEYGLNGMVAAADQAGSNYAGGPIQPGSEREFTERTGDTVYFTTDSTALSAEAQKTLIAQAQWLNRYTQYPVLIEGHADERGTREYNLGLGAKRAATVKRFLITRGVEPGRIGIVTYGKERPVAVCANISCWSQNRRAVTVLRQHRVAAR